MSNIDQHQEDSSSETLSIGTVNKFQKANQSLNSSVTKKNVSVSIIRKDLRQTRKKETILQQPYPLSQIVSQKLSCSYRKARNFGEIIAEGRFSNGQKTGYWIQTDSKGVSYDVQYELVRVGAICRDGTTSHATGRGACSWHGGVGQWLYEPQRTIIGVRPPKSKAKQIQTISNRLKQRLNLKQEKQSLVLALLKQLEQRLDMQEYKDEEINQENSIINCYSEQKVVQQVSQKPQQVITKCLKKDQRTKDSQNPEKVEQKQDSNNGSQEQDYQDQDEDQDGSSCSQLHSQQSQQSQKGQKKKILSKKQNNIPQKIQGDQNKQKCVGSQQKNEQKRQKNNQSRDTLNQTVTTLYGKRLLDLSTKNATLNQ